MKKIKLLTVVVSIVMVTVAVTKLNVKLEQFDIYGKVVFYHLKKIEKLHSTVISIVLPGKDTVSFFGKLPEKKLMNYDLEFAQMVEGKGMTTDLFNVVFDVYSIAYDGFALWTYIKVKSFDEMGNENLIKLSGEDRQYWKYRVQNWYRFNGLIEKIEFYNTEGKLVESLNPGIYGKFKAVMGTILFLKFDLYKEKMKLPASKDVGKLVVYLSEDEVENVNDYIKDMYEDDKIMKDRQAVPPVY